MGITLQKYTTWDTFNCIMSKNGGFRFSSLENFNDLFEIADIEEPERYKILCFTASNKSTLMWSHYGHSYEGCCITLDLNRYKNVIWEDGKVKYKSRNYRKTNALSDIEKLKIKGTRWQYEHEYRIILDLEQKNNQYNGLTQKVDDFFFLIPYIKKVYIGCRTKDTVEYKKALELIQSINIKAKENDKRRKNDLIEVFKYVIGKTGYSLEIDKSFDYSHEIERLKEKNNLQHENKSCEKYPCKAITNPEEKIKWRRKF